MWEIIFLLNDVVIQIKLNYSLILNLVNMGDYFPTLRRGDPNQTKIIVLGQQNYCIRFV